MHVTSAHSSMAAIMTHCSMALYTWGVGVWLSPLHVGFGGLAPGKALQASSSAAVLPLTGKWAGVHARRWKAERQPGQVRGAYTPTPAGAGKPHVPTSRYRGVASSTEPQLTTGPPIKRQRAGA